MLVATNVYMSEQSRSFPKIGALARSNNLWAGPLLVAHGIESGFSFLADKMIRLTMTRRAVA